jgi:hypothetical protein
MLRFRIRKRKKAAYLYKYAAFCFCRLRWLSMGPRFHGDDAVTVLPRSRGAAYFAILYRSSQCAYGAGSTQVGRSTPSSLAACSG